MLQKLPAGQCVKASESKVPQAKLVFSSGAGSGIWNCAYWKGVSVLQPLVLFLAYMITSQRIVALSTCCVISAQWAQWEGKVLGLVKRENI